MPTRPCSLMVVAMTLLLAGLVATSVAYSEAESIYLAGQKVITIRDKGTYPSITERARAIDKAICEVISTKDTQHPNITVKESDGQWTVYAWDIKIASVTAAEAKANNITAKSLAAIWAKNLKEAFPKATPVSRLAGAATRPRPVGVSGATTVPMTVGPGATEVPSTPSVLPRPTPSPTPTATPTVSSRGPSIGAPTLIVRDAFNTVRALPEEDYLAQRDQLVAALIQDLTPFITGKIPSAPLGPTSPGIETPTPGSAARPEVSAGSPETGRVAPGPRPAVTSTPIATAPAAVNLPQVKPGNPAYAKVPQKNRIRTKLERARLPFLRLKQEDPAAAAPIEQLLAICRQAFAKGDFDESEQAVDAALEQLGLQP